MGLINAKEVREFFTKICTTYPPITADGKSTILEKCEPESDIIVSKFDVYMELQKIKPNTSSYPDELPVKFLCEYAAFIALPLSIIINECFASDYFPSVETGFIRVIPKAPLPLSACNDLRLISPTPCLVKVTDVFVLKFLLKQIHGRIDKFQYAWKGHTETVEYLIQSGADANIRKHFGATLLYLAARKAHSNECLIQFGADLNIKTEEGASPLHFAAWNGNTHTVECLLKSGPDVNIRNNYGETPLNLAAWKGHTETVEYLIQSGADVNIRNNYGETPLNLAAWKGHTETVEYLIQSGADVNIRNNYAAWKGHTETVEYLIQSGADVNIRNNYGETPLNLAAWKGHTETVEYLIQSGADVNIRNNYGETPLNSAAWKGHTETVEYLIQSGADVNIRNNYGETPLNLAAWKGHTEIVEYLIQSGANVNIRHNYGETPLNLAAWKGHTEAVEYLIQSGADVNIRNNYGETPLYLAARKGHTETVEYLIQSGTDVNVKNEDGASPLHLSCSSVSISISQTCECLLKYGAYVNSKDKYVMTVLHYASRSGDKECVATILEHGSDIDITDRNDRTAFDAAVDDTAVYFASHVLKLRVANLNVSERNIRLSDKTQTSYPANELKDSNWVFSQKFCYKFSSGEASGKEAVILKLEE
ncbi:putative ankyrin repeat protein RF_0381 [Artemia franciscana]|uniref:putative ankyrin repeat protein RF_0381 n=1 Tax=Artemia franciscana TaxID=6661 RepID=UPI0032DAA220